MLRRLPPRSAHDAAVRPHPSRAWSSPGSVLAVVAAPFAAVDAASSERTIAVRPRPQIWRWVPAAAVDEEDGSTPSLLLLVEGDGGGAAVRDEISPPAHCPSPPVEDDPPPAAAMDLGKMMKHRNRCSGGALGYGVPAEGIL
ncbi:hypothetical protein ACLOJK_029139 [Asimina triloba]